jgi:predicted dehydrogenase
MKSSQKPLRIAAAGLGRIGWRPHAVSLARHADFRLVAVSDAEADRRAEAERKLKCRAFADYAQMLEQPELDAVVIATPTHFHKAMALAALRRGLHVILEKPMALDGRESAVVIRAARSRRRVLTVHQPLRLMANFQHVRRDPAGRGHVPPSLVRPEETSPEPAEQTSGQRGAQIPQRRDQVCGRDGPG